MDTDCEMKCIPMNVKQSDPINANKSSDGYNRIELILAIVESLIIIAVIIRFYVRRCMTRLKAFQQAITNVTAEHNNGPRQQESQIWQQENTNIPIVCQQRQHYQYYPDCPETIIEMPENHH